MKTMTKQNMHKYFQEIFSPRKILEKIFWISLIGSIVCLSCTLIYFLLIKYLANHSSSDPIIGQNKFLFLHIVWNEGVGFSFMSGSQWWKVSLLQGLVSLFIFLILLFMKNKTLYLPIIFIFFGGLYNFLQRTLDVKHAVLDYFQFGFWPGFAIFNLPDVFVCCGVVAFVISYFIVMIQQAQKSNDENETKN